MARTSRLRARAAALAVAVTAVMATAAPAGAVTRLVDDDGRQCPNAPFSSVQAAVDAAVPGEDAVVLCAGVHEGDVRYEPHGPGRGSAPAITIKSRRPYRATVRGDWYLCSFEGPAVVRELVVEGRMHVGCGGGSEAIVERNRVHGTISMFNGWARIRHNVVTDFERTGIDLGGSNYGATGSADVRANRVHGGPGTVGIRLWEGRPFCYGAFEVDVAFNVVTGSDTGVLSEPCAIVRLVGNRVTGNQTGVRLWEADLVERNRITGNAGDGLVAAQADDRYARVVRNDLRGNGGLDCVLEEGPRPAGWHSNLGNDSSPAGLCTPDG